MPSQVGSTACARHSERDRKIGVYRAGGSEMYTQYSEYGKYTSPKQKERKTVQSDTKNLRTNAHGYNRVKAMMKMIL